MVTAAQKPCLEVEYRSFENEIDSFFVATSNVPPAKLECFSFLYMYVLAVLF